MYLSAVAPQFQGRILILTVCAAGIGGTFQYGYNLTIISAPTTVSPLACLNRVGKHSFLPITPSGWCYGRGKDAPPLVSLLRLQHRPARPVQTERSLLFGEGERLAVPFGRNLIPSAFTHRHFLSASQYDWTHVLWGHSGPMEAAVFPPCCH